MTEAPDRVRDRAATEAAIVAAARALLAEGGFQALGINAVARRAGCDKQLIYRYFDGIEGLVERIGADLGDWVNRALAPLDALGRPDSYAELVERLLLGYLQALRDDPMMQRIAIWELSDDSPMVRRLRESRSRGLGVWIAEHRGDLTPPEGSDAPAMNAFLIAGTQHLVLAAARSGEFAGLGLVSDEEWNRARAALRRMIRLIYA